MQVLAPVRAFYHRLLRLRLRIGLSVLVLFVLIYCGLRAYTVYLTHRAVLLLDEATRIQIGDSEESVLPLVARYGGIKQLPPPPEPTDDCRHDTVGHICFANPPESSADREYRIAHTPDYTYAVALSPFNVFSAFHQELRGIHLALGYLMFRTPIFVRNLFSLRDWRAYAYIEIRGGRVESVGSGLWVEGRDRWLAHSWALSPDLRNPDKPQETYRADEGWLELNTTGNMTDHYLTPAATAEQLQAARSINTDCLTGLIPCSSLHDLSPRAYEYKKRHPEADSNLE